MFPLHTWLPLAHVEAPTAGSVLLAGVLLKIGVYGFLRLCLPLAPDASATIGVPLIGTLAVIGIIYLQMGKHKEATDHFKKSIELYKTQKNIAGQAAAWGNLAIIANRQKNRALTIEYSCSF